MFCGGLQLRCIHPDCKEPLFSAKAELCHKCSRSQQISETSSTGAKHVAANPVGPTGGMNNANSEMDNGNVATDEKNATKAKSAEATPPDESSTHVEEPIQESQATQTIQNAGSNTSDHEPPGDSSVPPAPEKDPHKNHPKNRPSSADQTNGKRPPSAVVSEVLNSEDSLADEADFDQTGYEHKKMKQQRGGKADQEEQDQKHRDEDEIDHPLKEVYTGVII